MSSDLDVQLIALIEDALLHKPITAADADILYTELTQQLAERLVKNLPSFELKVAKFLRKEVEVVDKRCGC